MLRLRKTSSETRLRGRTGEIDDIDVGPVKRSGRTDSA